MQIHWFHLDHNGVKFWYGHNINVRWDGFAWGLMEWIMVVWSCNNRHVWLYVFIDILCFYYWIKTYSQGPLIWCSINKNLIFLILSWKERNLYWLSLLNEPNIINVFSYYSCTSLETHIGSGELTINKIWLKRILDIGSRLNLFNKSCTEANGVEQAGFLEEWKN